MSLLPRRDGHTHTEFCRHGSHEATDLFVRRAIELGFVAYSLTEHPPLPPGFEDPAPEKDCGILAGQVEPYLELGFRQKRQFAGQVDLKVGFEVDYIPGYEVWTRELLDRYGGDLDDALLSVHFLPGAGGWRCVDHSPEDFRQGLLEPYGSVEAVHRAYWQMVRQAISADLGPHKPRRIGHLSLVHKFQAKYPLSSPEQFRPEVEEILGLMKAGEMEVDLDAAGLYKPDCREIYPAPWIVKEAIRLGIRLVYGSDTHSVRGVGQGYDEALRIVTSLHPQS